MKKLLLGLMAVSLYGCGADSLRRIDPPGAPVPGSSEATPGDRTPGSPPGGNGIGAGAGTRTALRLKGTDAEAFRSVLAQISGARVLVDGKPVDVQLTGGVLELARSGHAWSVGTFALPEGAQRVEVALTFDDYGGYETDAAAGVVNLRIPALRFDAPASYFGEHSHAVVHLNLARSLKPQGRELLMMPDFQIHY